MLQARRLGDEEEVIPVKNLEQIKALATEAPFNDPGLSLQWHYHNEGNLPNSVAGADINLYRAWKVTAGSREVIVAVVDGGIDYNHEDLRDNVWINEDEQAGMEYLVNTVIGEMYTVGILCLTFLRLFLILTERMWLGRLQLSIIMGRGYVG